MWQDGGKKPLKKQTVTESPVRHPEGMPFHPHFNFQHGAPSEVPPQQASGCRVEVHGTQSRLEQNGQTAPDSRFKEPVADVIEVGRVRTR